MLLCLHQKINADELDAIYQNNSFHSTREQVDYLLKSCWENRVSYPQQALNYGFEALKLIKDNPQYTHEIAVVNNYIGVIYLNYLYDYKSSLPYYHEALRVSQNNNDSIQIAYSYNNIGDIYYYIKNNELAIEYGEKSLQIFKNLKDTSGILYSLTNVGMAHIEAGNLELGKETFEKQYQIASQIKNEDRIIYALYQIGNAYQKQDSIEQAKKYYNLAIDRIAIGNNLKSEAECLTELANINYLESKFQDAISQYNESLELANHNNYIYSKILNHAGLALVYSKLNDKECGLGHLEKSIDLAKSIDNPLYVFDVFDTQINFFQNFNDTANLIETYNLYVSEFYDFLAQYDNKTMEILQNSMQDKNTITTFQYNLQQINRERFYLLVIIILMIFIVIYTIYRNKITSSLNKQLKGSNDTKDRLFSIISHDLRSPFNSAMGFSDLILLESENDKESNTYKYAKTLNKTLENTLALINNLLSWAKSNRDSFQLKQTDINIYKLIEEIVDIKSTALEKKNIAIEILGDLHTNAKIDKGSIFTVLTNLLSNAIKFTPNNGSITFEITLKNDTIEINVKDSGIGMSENQIHNLFNIKESKSTLGTNKEIGTGLGLIISKELIEKNGGSIEVRSKIDHGTTFTVILPK